MSQFKIQFCHPVRGHIRLTQQERPQTIRSLLFITRDDLIADVRIDDLAAGQWTALWQWENEGRDYIYTSHFCV